MLAELVSIVAPVYLIIGLGFWWVRTGRPWSTEVVGELITRVGAPCLVFSSLTRVEISGAAMWEMAGAVCSALAVLAALGTLVLRAARLPISTYLSPIVIMNAGNMGLPLSLFAFGSEGLALAVCYWATCAIVFFTVGQWIWSGRVSLLDLVRSPLAWAAALATASLVSGVAVPRWLQNTTELLGGFTIPLLQFSLGTSLGQFALRGLPRGLALAALRIGMGFAVGLALASVWGLEGNAYAVFVLLSAMPVAVVNYLMAERYDRAPAEIASLIVISTLLSFATVPAILAWLLA